MIRKVLGRYGLVQFIGAAVRDDWYGRLVRYVAPIANRLLGKSPVFTDVMVSAINLYRGIPTDDFARQAYFKSYALKPAVDIDPARDRCGMVWIGPVVPFTSELVMKVLALTKRIFEKHEIDFFVEVIVESARSVIVRVGVFYERTDPADAARARGLVRRSTRGLPGARLPALPDHHHEHARRAGWKARRQGFPEVRQAGRRLAEPDRARALRHADSVSRLEQ